MAFQVMNGRQQNIHAAMQHNYDDIQTLRLSPSSTEISTTENGVLENAAAADLVLDEDDLAKLDKAFPPPRRKQALAMS